MGRFPWSHGHSKQGSETAHTVTHEWFSKEHAEPSRQALTELMKEYSSFESGNGGISPKARTRSRANTVASSFSVYAKSISDASNDMASRPSSRQSFVDYGMPLPERHESTTRNLLARGTRILKRQGSKLNLLPFQIEEKSNELPGAIVGEQSPPKGLPRQPTLNSRGLKRSISGPFAFQHLTHADQARFQSLDSVSKTDLSSEFIAVQSDQQPDDQIRGIPVADLPVTRDVSTTGVGFEEPASPTTDAIPYLPITPPRPQPPPKDGLMSPYNLTDFRLSRSMENFSRPTRLSVTALDISPPTTKTQRLSALSPISHANVLAKPLPYLPDSEIVHAVSTRDDIALPLPTAPLPSPPRAVMEVVKEETVEESGSLLSTRSCFQPSMLHSLPVPTARQLKRRSQSSGDLQFSAVSFAGLPEMSKVDTAKHTGDEASPKSKNRVSIAVKATGMEDWDDAIDYSWEHAAELEEHDGVYNESAIFRQPSNLSIPLENYLVVEQSHIDETASSSSTPLMMQMPDKPYREGGDPSTHQVEEHPRLLGLGIDSMQPHTSATFSRAAVGASHEVEARLSSGSTYHSRVMRSPVSMMSKSSSQESFIASIFGTHRSSNSSASLSDFAHLASGSFEGSMENLKLDFQDFTSAPTTEQHIREGSQDTIREDSQDTKLTDGLADMGPIAPLPNFDASPIPKHDRGASASAIPSIPRRKSSLTDATDLARNQTGRRRAATGASRPRRNTRVSYSLFPTTATN